MSGQNPIDFYNRVILKFGIFPIIVNNDLELTLKEWMRLEQKLMHSVKMRFQS